MDTTEIIHNALEWANKRLELQGEPITENQRNYIVFALRQQLTIPIVVGSACDDYVEGINMQCASCDQPKYKH